MESHPPFFTSVNPTILTARVQVRSFIFVLLWVFLEKASFLPKSLQGGRGGGKGKPDQLPLSHVQGSPQLITPSSSPSPSAVVLSNRPKEEPGLMEQEEKGRKKARGKKDGAGGRAGGHLVQKKTLYFCSILQLWSVKRKVQKY